MIPDFVGRSEYLTALDGLLLEEREDTSVAAIISAVDGAAGIGKTTLAVHWAHRAQRHFPDGTLYSNLRGYGPGAPASSSEVLEGFLRALGTPVDWIPVGLEARTGLYRSLLAGRQMLVVLDNASTAEQVRMLLPGSSRCRVVVTSRDSLLGLVIGEGAVRLTLDLLTATEAVEMVESIVGRQRAEMEPDAVLALTTVCARLPLALRVAACRATGHVHATVADVVAELADDRHRLDALSRGRDERAAVRTVFSWSYRRLGAEQARLFRCLGLHPSSEFSVEAAAAALGSSRHVTCQLLDELADAHLIEPVRPTRYRMHDLLFSYAAERAAQDEGGPDHEAAVRRIHGWYLHTADVALRALHSADVRLPLPLVGPGVVLVSFDNDAEASEWLETERQTVIAAVHSAADHDLGPIVWHLADALSMFPQGPQNAAVRAAVHIALAVARRAGEVRAEGRLHSTLGNVHSHLGEYPQARDHFAQAIAKSRHIGDLNAEAIAIGDLGVMERELGNLRDAEICMQQALVMGRKASSATGQAAPLANLSFVYHKLGDFTRARDCAQQALTLYNEGEHLAGQTIALVRIGIIDCDQGLLDQADDHLRRALSKAVRLRDSYRQTIALRGLASVARRKGELHGAEQYARAALASARKIGYPPGEVDALVELAIQLRALERFQEALDCAEGARSRACATGQQLRQGEAFCALAEVHLDLGEFRQGIEHAEHALMISRSTGHRLGEGRALRTLGHAYERTGRHIDAAQCWNMSQALLAETGATFTKRQAW
ncbi:ATP-binding protein [Amycolatopsis sp. cmx-11-12]|uniref:ATP-binding protein n=1 Tax=Amycolatopsis sp. cmx-11-12 TaxID=2785795 RepID=UPI0039182C10